MHCVTVKALETQRGKHSTKQKRTDTEIPQLVFHCRVFNNKKAIEI